MPSKLMRDPDMRFFAHQLQTTPEGRRYQQDWRCSLACLRRIMMIRKHPNHYGPAELEAARRAYLIATDNCSMSLSTLEIHHAWPPP